MEIKVEIFLLKDNTFRNLKVIYLFNWYLLTGLKDFCGKLKSAVEMEGIIKNNKLHSLFIH